MTWNRVFLQISCPYGSFVMEGARVVFLHKFIEKQPGTGWTQAGRTPQDTTNSEGTPLNLARKICCRSKLLRRNNFL